MLHVFWNTLYMHKYDNIKSTVEVRNPYSRKLYNFEIDMKIIYFRYARRRLIGWMVLGIPASTKPEFPRDQRQHSRSEQQQQ